MARLRHSRAWIATTALALTSSACAALFPSIEDDPNFGEYFSMRSGGASRQSKLEGPRLYGTDVELLKLEDGYRGRANGQVIDLRSDGSKIQGTVGSGQTELYVREQDGALILNGLYNAQLGQLELRHATLYGKVGDCQYDLRRATRESVWYEGKFSCGGQIRAARLALPTALGARPADDRAVLLAVVLGR